MVEIKRTRAGQGYKMGRIGVVNVQSGSERVYEQKAKGYGQFADFMFEQTASMQKKAGAEFAAEAQVLDDDGKVVSKKVPSGLGKYGQEVAVQEINRRMSVATQNEMKSVAAQFKQVAKNSSDPANAFRFNMETYIAQRTKDITESGGEDFIPTFNEIAYNIGSLAEVGLRLDKQQEVNEIAANEELTLYTEQVNEAYNRTVNGDVLGGGEIYNQVVSDIDASPLLSPSVKATFKRKAESDMRLGVVRSAAKDKTPGQLESLRQDARKNIWSAQTLEDNPQLQGINLSEDEWNATKTYYNGVADASSSALKQQVAQAQAVVEFETGFIANNSANQKNVSVLLEQSSMLDVLAAKGYNKEKLINGPIASSYFTDLAVSFSTGALPEEGLLPTLELLVNTKAAQQYKGKTLATFFGGAEGKKVQRAVTQFSMLQELGGDDFAVEKYKTYLLNKANPTEFLRTVTKNSDFSYDRNVSDEQNIRNAARYEMNKLTNIPAHLRGRMIAAAETFLGTPDLDFGRAVEAYARDNYSAKDGFYEQSGGYDAYPYSPSTVLDSAGQELLRIKVDNMVFGKKVYLKSLPNSSDAEVVWQAYYLDENKSQQQVGRPISLRGFSNFIKVKESMKRQDYYDMQKNKQDEMNAVNEFVAEGLQRY